MGGPELLLVFLVVLLVFGPRRIPEVARGLGKGLRELRRLSTELQREIHLADATEEEEERARSRAGASPSPRGARPPAPGEPAAPVLAPKIGEGSEPRSASGPPEETSGT